MTKAIKYLFANFTFIFLYIVMAVPEVVVLITKFVSNGVFDLSLLSLRQIIFYAAHSVLLIGTIIFVFMSTKKKSFSKTLRLSLKIAFYFNWYTFDGKFKSRVFNELSR